MVSKPSGMDITLIVTPDGQVRAIEIELPTGKRRIDVAAGSVPRLDAFAGSALAQARASKVDLDRTKQGTSTA